MKESTFTYTDQDGIEVFVYKWKPKSSPKAAVQIIHGMAEHALRYTPVAEALCNEGYICYGEDHHGNGKTAGDLTAATLEGNAGVLGPNGWVGMINSIHELSKIIKKENPKIPLFLIGHSMGSWLAQDYMQRWGDEIKGTVLSGTDGKISKILLKFGRKFANGEIKKIGPNTPSEKMDHLSLKSFNNQWDKEENATGFEWLTRDKAEVKKYIDDPWSGYISPASFYLALFDGMEKIWTRENEEKIPKDLPIFMIAGTLDPVSDKTKKVKILLKHYEEYGIKDVTHKFYEDARHEVFNEINREEVLRDVINWLNSHL